ncbi:FecR family protein [Algoriphagus sp. A40]|uniref:FecR family protein n=1 Tax=Algoriphagus sp. A40 TaxID=1945863 RepID=UPI000985B883|nr:FecR family protein [Algoriphagus sp. A40]OOG78207.1 hypothetical protein B0E43_02020 [Algoriphagus sp. A40]
MDISKYSVEDFVLDREFRIWILSPDKNSNIHWESVLVEKPELAKKALIARDIVLNLKSRDFDLSISEGLILWDSIENELGKIDSEPVECEIIPINSGSVLKKSEFQSMRFNWFSQWFRVAGILILAFAFSVVFNLIYKEEIPVKLPPVLVFQEHKTPPGVKSTMTLQDGSKVMLNSGSSIRYVKNFETDQRILFLEGEAYFEVAKDSLRPFSVITGSTKTTALGTAFNISSYKNEDTNVSLVEGKVAVEVEENRVDLEKGEALKINRETGGIKKGQFDTELVLAWTKKKIIFQQVKMMEAIRVLENWYGVKFILKNKPKPDLLIFGVYEDEILENVLNGLSYTARFDYKIDQDEVEITFK